MGFEAGNEVQVKTNERGDFSWLEFYGKRTKETLSGQQMVKGEIQFKPSNPEIAKRLEPTEIKFLEQFADLKVTYWVKDGVDVSQVISNDETNFLLLGGGLIAPVKQWEIDEEASIIGDTYKKLGDKGQNVVSIGISLPGFDQSRFKKGEVTDEQESSESAARLAAIVGKLLKCHSQNTVFVGHSSYAEAGLKHLTDVCQVIALEPPLSEGSDPVFTMISGLNELSTVGDMISKSWTDSIRDGIIRWRAGLNVKSKQGEQYSRAAQKLANLHKEIMERAYPAYKVKCKDLARKDKGYERKRVVRYQPDVLLGDADILTPAKAGLAWLDKNFELLNGITPSKALTEWASGEGMPKAIGHDTPLIRDDVIDLVTERIKQRIENLPKVLSRHYLGQEPLGMPEFESKVVGRDGTKESVKGDYIYQIATRVGEMSVRERMAVARSFNPGNEYWDRLESMGCKYFEAETAQRFKLLLHNLRSGKMTNYIDFEKDLGMLFLEHPIAPNLKIERMLPDSFANLDVRDKTRIMISLNESLYEDAGIDLHFEMINLDFPTKGLKKNEDALVLHYSMLDIVTKLMVSWVVKSKDDKIELTQLFKDEEQRRLELLVGNGIETGVLDYLTNKLSNQLTGNT